MWTMLQQAGVCLQQQVLLVGPLKWTSMGTVIRQDAGCVAVHVVGHQLTDSCDSSLQPTAAAYCSGEEQQHIISNN
jgi:cytochrome c551/c552